MNQKTCTPMTVYPAAANPLLTKTYSMGVITMEQHRSHVFD